MLLYGFILFLYGLFAKEKHDTVTVTAQVKSDETTRHTTAVVHRGIVEPRNHGTETIS